MLSPQLPSWPWEHNNQHKNLTTGDAAGQAQGDTKQFHFCRMKNNPQAQEISTETPLCAFAVLDCCAEGTVQKEEHLFIPQPDFYKLHLRPVQELMNHINS